MFKGLIFRVVGAPPAPGATRVEQLRWVRKFYRLTVAAMVVVVVFALMDGGTFLWIVAAVGAVMCAGGLTSISVSIHRERPRR